LPSLGSSTVAVTRPMRSGAEVIYQAALVAPPWLGYADFLERVDESSDLGQAARTCDHLELALVAGSHL
jgi:hypothetical protein